MSARKDRKDEIREKLFRENLIDYDLTGMGAALTKIVDKLRDTVKNTDIKEIPKEKAERLKKLLLFYLDGFIRGDIYIVDKTKR